MVQSGAGSNVGDDRMPPVSAARVREATQADAEAIAAIYAESVDAGGSTLDTEAPPASRFAAELADPSVHLVVAELEGSIVVAWGRSKPWSPKRGYARTRELSTFVAQAHRRRGLWRLVTAALIAEAEASGAHHLVARIFADNEPSMALYSSLGFELVGIQRQIGWRDGAWVDVALLQRLRPR